MASDLKLTDDGFLNLSIGEVSKRVDLWCLYNSMLEARAEVTEGEQPIRVFHEKVSKILEEQGFPGCSHKVANDVATALQEMVEGQKKTKLPSTPQSSAESSESSSPASKAA
jgi:hypothetical protein